ncbi:MAG: CFI-box-CTERM domain-containing protein [Bacillota bacterium]
MNLAKLFSIPVALMMMAPMAQGALTYSSISGVSNIDTTDLTKPIVYGGFAGTCASPDNSNTCDTCVQTSSSTNKFLPCNKNAVYPTLNMLVVLKTDVAINVSDVTVKIDSTSITTGTITTTGAGGTISIPIPWQNICSAATSGDTNCATSFSKDLTISVASSSSSSSSGPTFTFRVTTQSKDSTSDSFYTDCPVGVTPAASGGFCHFTAAPGDKKIYANDLAVSSDYPASGSSVDFKNLMFFYEEQTATDTSDSDTVARISNGSNAFSVPVSATVSPPIVDERINDLNNDTTYCLVMANQDMAGNIYNFTPVASVAASTLCATPEPVAGLLDDKHCFIATAAFGSEMAPEVQSFRDFRNKYLIPYSWGRKFVKAYYHYSPKYAAMISGNETAKTVVRAALWPLLLMARMSVAFGFWVAALIMTFALLSFFELYRRLILGRKVRGEL